MKPHYEIGTPYFVIARNAHAHTFNRMHTDGLPQQLGFRGALVLGLASYGNMTRALVSHYGDSWLGNALVYVKLHSVVCEGDRLRMETTPVEGKKHTYKVRAYNETNQGLLATELETSIPGELPPLDPLSSMEPNEWEGPVTELRTWDNVVPNKPYRSLRTTLSTKENEHWKNVLGEDLPIYYEGEHPPIHPTHVLRLAQLASLNQYQSDTAMHSWTRAVIRKVLRVGDKINVLIVPVEKWKKKANDWVTMYCAIRSGPTGKEVYAEMYHTQIFKVGERAKQQQQ